MIKVDIRGDKSVYFASDQHFGIPNAMKSLERERCFIHWLEYIAPNAAALFLQGDLFDFWFEYKKVVPKGFTRVLGKLATLSDQGLPIYYFVGNHDLWIEDYFQKELSIPVYHKPKSVEIQGTRFLIGHGDGLGPGDKGYKRMKQVFIHPLSKWFFRWLHPDIGVRLGHYLSTRNKLISGNEEAKFLGEDNEWLVQYCKEQLTREHYDYFVFGHRHLPMDIPLNNQSRYINLGDWISYFSYGIFDGRQFTLMYFKDQYPLGGVR